MNDWECLHDRRGECWLCSDAVSWWRQARHDAGLSWEPPNRAKPVSFRPLPVVNRHRPRDMKILTFIKDHPGCITRDIEEALDIEQPAISVCTMSLAERGLIRRYRLKDERGRPLRYYPAGWTLHKDGTCVLSQTQPWAEDGATDHLPQSIGMVEFRNGVQAAAEKGWAPEPARRARV